MITQLAVYTAYIPCRYILPPGGLYNHYHLLPEPEQFYDCANDSRILLKSMCVFAGITHDKL